MTAEIGGGAWPRHARLIIGATFVGLGFALACKVAEYALFGDVTFGVDPWAFLALPCSLWLFQRDRRAIILAFFVGLAIASVLQSVLRLTHFPIVTGFGAATFLVICLKLLIRKDERKTTFFVLCAGLMAPVAQSLCPLFQRVTSIYPLTLDGRAALVDLSLGVPASMPFVLHSWLNAWQTRLAIYNTYSAITFALGLLILMKLTRADREWLVATIAFALAGVIGSAIYHLVPIAGPVYAFIMQPGQEASVDPIPVSIEAVRNGMPSLHAAWAFLLFLNSRTMGRVARAGFALFLVATLCSTLILAEHYVIDLVVAAPFALALQVASQAIVSTFSAGEETNPTFDRLAVFLFAAISTAAWIALLRYEPGVLISTPYVTQGLTAVSLLGFAIGAHLLVARRVVVRAPDDAALVGRPHRMGLVGTGPRADDGFGRRCQMKL